MDTFNAVFFPLPLSVSSLDASKPLHLSIESHPQNSYWYLIYMGFYLYCMVNTLIHIYTQTTFYSTGRIQRK